MCILKTDHVLLRKYYLTLRPWYIQKNNAQEASGKFSSGLSSHLGNSNTAITNKFTKQNTCTYVLWLQNKHSITLHDNQLLCVRHQTTSSDGKTRTTEHGTSHEDLNKNCLRLLISRSPLIKILGVTLPAGKHESVIPILISIAVRSFTFTGSLQYQA